MALFILFRIRGSAVLRLCRLPLAHTASLWLLLLVAAVPTRAEPPDNSTRAVTALRVDQPPQIDGHLSEPAWQQAEAAGDFFRAQQTRGMPARLRTEAFVLYDAEAIYVGFRCWEPDMTGLRVCPTPATAPSKTAPTTEMPASI